MSGHRGAVVTGVLVLMLVLVALLLAAFIYQIAATPLTAVDAPTLIKSAAAPSAPAPAPPDRPRHARPAPLPPGRRLRPLCRGPRAGGNHAARPW